ncbi:phosphoribosylglycinamide formyltransferase [Candidatus Omnitrophota bacterium]
MNIAIFASGRGTNFSAIVRAAKKGKIPGADISLLVCDNPKAPVIAKARRAGVEVFLIKRNDFASKSDFEKAIIQRLNQAGIDLIILAGFMRILGPDLIQAFKFKILNIHPALLPSFKGAHGIKDAFDYGVKVTGVTVHFVDEEMDHGPIILQAAVKRDPKDTMESLESKIHKVEHKIYPEAVRLFVEGRLRMEGRRVINQ